MHTIDRQNIEDFWVVGINYKKSDASVRGAFAITNEQYHQAFSLAPQYGIDEFLILSTCNRTEIYGFAPGMRQLMQLLCSISGGDEQVFESISYAKSSNEAIEHLFQVAAGLDSQILGDYEILGQIKTAAKLAKACGFIGTFMERLLNSVLQASKAIKTHTALSGGTVSVAFAAVQYIREYFEGPSVTAQMKCPASSHLMTDSSPRGMRMTTDDKKIVLLGTGKIGRSACRNLVDYLGTTNITLINRTNETAVNLAAELGLSAAPMETLDRELTDADIVIVSTSAKEPVVTKAHLEGRGRKLVIDLSVPCNVAADARQLPGITFVDVDVLSKIKDETLQHRKSEIPKAMVIIAEHIREFGEWYAMRRHVPVLKEVKDKLKEIYIDPVLLGRPQGDDEKIQKVINSLAAKMRRDNAPGCHYIEAINEYIA